MNIQGDINELFRKWQADYDQVTRANLSMQQSIDVLNEQLTNTESRLLDALALPIKGKPRFGINLHLFSDPVYADINKVITALQDTGIKYVRQDFDIDVNGKMLQHDKWIAYKPLFDAAGIHVRPMFYTMRGNDGFATFKGIAENYPEFDEMEIGNEGAVATKNATMTNGQKASEYDTAKLNANIKWVTGAYLALLTAVRPIKAITSITWIHYYYIDQLRAAGVNLWLSVHSYSDGFWNVANQASTKGLTSWQAAKSHYGDMVFEIGETGYLPKDLSIYTDANQLREGSKIINDTYGAGVDIYFFELFDRGKSKGRESALGIYRSDWTAKPLQGFIKELLK